MLVNANDLNLLGDNKHYKEKHRNTDASKWVGLEVNTEYVAVLSLECRATS
jgi:hypothetical protein